MSESLGSEIHVPAKPGTIKEIRIDEKTGATTVEYAHCSKCGAYLPPEKWFRCSNGDLACKDHITSFETDPYCHKHYELEVMSKGECKVAVLVSMGFGPKHAPNLCNMDEKQALEAVAALVRKEMLVVTYCVFRHKYKLTERGYAAMGTGIEVFRREADFALTLKNTGRDPDGG
jgi:predicted transcriptional regulator